MDRAMEGCIDDISLGVLFALELYRYVFAGLLMYAEHPLFRPTRFLYRNIS
jgi:2-iminoacetate synthase